MKRNDQLLDRLEHSINKLKLEYDIFFNGGASQFPQTRHEEVKTEVRRLYNLASLTNVQRFRLNSLASRLTAYNDLWNRNLRRIEQGKKATYGVRPSAETAQKIEVPVLSENDRDSIDALFQAFCRARERTGHEAPIDPLKFEQFVSAKLRAAKTEVVFIVSTEDGEVHLKTRVIR